MLKDHDALPTVAVSDLDAARAFYGGKLGLDEVDAPDGMGLLLYRSGAATIVVYQSEYAGSNRATSVTWGVGDDFDAVLGALERAGVPFERYDMPGMTLAGNVHTAGDFKGAWARDPDGNLLHLNNQ